MTIEILEYLDGSGRSLYGKWFDRLNARAAAKVTAAIDRIGRGLMTNVQSVGSSVYERKVNFGPGFRIYFGTETDGRVTTIIILLNGGTKKAQSTDIVLAKQCWKDYQSSKRRGEKSSH